jgi:DNA topoisomerase-3
LEKSLFIAEKPSVAREFAAALKEKMTSKDGYMESGSYVVTWCVGHLITMSYPDAYDEKYKKWSFDTIPFIPDKFKYEIIPAVRKQFDIVSGLLNREDVTTIYVCTDSGREGEYIYRLVAMMAHVGEKKQKRVWIDSQTEEEILRGIKEAKDLSEYDNLSASAYLRAKEDYLMGINFSRVLSLKYGYAVSNFLGGKYRAISVGRVMTCVLGMVVKREREIRNFKKTAFYRVLSSLGLNDRTISAEWKCTEKSRYFNSPLLYKDNGFLKKEEAQRFVGELKAVEPQEMRIESVSNKKETKNPPLLFNLAELQNECSKRFKISPDQTLQVVQELYEKKLVTYPRTDARVLSSAVAKEIYKNIKGLQNVDSVSGFASEILENGAYKNIAKTKYTNDKQITDHYAIIPTGQGVGGLAKLPKLFADIYELIARRFLSIFYPPAVYRKISITAAMDGESFFANFKALEDAGYLKVYGQTGSDKDKETDKDGDVMDASLLNSAAALKKGMSLPVKGFEIKEGETSPPKRYTSGSMILAMENAGQLIEDEDLREQIKGSGIGTSATRAEILKKLFAISYLSLNKKTQVITPTLLGEMITDVVASSIRSLLNPELTASWEKGLTYVADGEVSPDEYMVKLSGFVSKYTEYVKGQNNTAALNRAFGAAAQYYKK